MNQTESATSGFRDVAMTGLGGLLCFLGINSTSQLPLPVSAAVFWAGFSALPMWGGLFRRITKRQRLAVRLSTALVPLVAATVWVVVTGQPVGIQNLAEARAANAEVVFSPSPEIGGDDLSKRLGMYPAFAKKVLATRLRDPDSAKISQLTAYTGDGQLTLCGMVNAKNGFGGFTGPEPFIVADSGIYLGAAEASKERIASECNGPEVAPIPEEMLD